MRDFAIDYTMEESLRQLLENEAVINYFKACQAMQSEQVMGLINKLDPNMLVDNFDMIFAKYVGILSQQNKSFSSDVFSAYVKRVLALDKTLDESVVDGLDWRHINAVISEHFVVLKVLYALKDLDTDLRNSVCDVLIPDSSVLYGSDDKYDVKHILNDYAIILNEYPYIVD